MLLVAPIVILGYAAGLKQGANGVAAGFSIAMVVLVLPIIFWAKRGTLISNGDIFKTVAVPLTSALAGAVAAWAARGLVGQVQPVFLKLVAECTILFGVYSLVLLFVMKQKSVYLDLMRAAGFFGLRVGHNHPTGSR
jgi:hypothetical protein